jgi:uncharacterized protein YggU (UPF0235/DUF167 family)
VTAWAATADGLTLALRVAPRGGADRIEGLVADAAGRALLAVRVSAPPAEGAANDAVVRLIAGALGVAKRDVKLLSGAQARVKRLAVAGDPAVLAARLAALVKGGA